LAITSYLQRDGMMLMAQAADLIVVFLALELLSIPLYVLAAFARPKAESEEAGLKYFLLGAFATGFVVYGTALVFGATGSTNLIAIVNKVGIPSDGTVNPAPVSPRLCSHPRRTRVQGRGGSLPHVDAGCLSGRALGGDRLHVLGREDRGLRGLAACLCHALPSPPI
jgi:hypothetical protein